MFRFYLVCFLSITVSLCQDGSCPPTLSVDVCDAECGPQRPCSSSQLCCPTTCGGSLCVDPMTRRHFVNYTITESLAYPTYLYLKLLIFGLIRKWP
ncbi:unnamed protein product [Parnassius mnemosyne]|uniref:WAP domain-containing protein n=1 Tax=Parnassius mnemosyne TaxID=213953 RepID=A0AAV1LUL3_9NEOP